MGRTGRKRTGGVLVLVTEGKEANKWEKANDNYRWIQNKIALGKDFQYEEDLSPRIIPADINPECEKQHIIPPAENLAPSPPRKAQGRVRKKAPPRKFNMPDGVETGFTTAAKLGGFKTSTLSNSGRSNATLNNDEDSDVASEDEASEDVFEPSTNPDAGLLNAEQEINLTRNYRKIIDTDSVEEELIIPYPRLDAFPEHQRYLTSTHIIKHSRTTKSFVHMLRKIYQFGEADIEKHKSNLKPEDKVFNKLPRTPRPTPKADQAIGPAFEVVITKKPASLLTSDMTKPAPSSLAKLAGFKAPAKKTTGLTERSSNSTNTINSSSTTRAIQQKPESNTKSSSKTKENQKLKSIKTSDMFADLNSSPSPSPSPSSTSSADLPMESSRTIRSSSEESEDLPSASQLLNGILKVNTLKRKSLVENGKPDKPVIKNKRPRVVVDSEDDEDIGI